MFRTADAFAVDKLFLVGYTAHPPKPQIDKVALGAETWIEWEGRDDIFELIEELKKSGYQIIALEETDSSVVIEDVPLQKKIALIVGQEVDEVSEEILSVCDAVTHMKMYGKKKSLNVSVAAGIAMHVLRRRLGN